MLPNTATCQPREKELSSEQITEWGKTMRQLHLDIPRNSLLGGNVTAQRLVALGVAASVHNPKAGYMQVLRRSKQP